jgi:hypothetical protein
MLKHLIAAGIILAGASMAHADECRVTYDQGITVAKQAVEQDPEAVLVVYTGDEAKALLKAINETDPPTDFVAERIITIDIPGAFVVVGLVDKTDCIFQSYKIPQTAWSHLSEAALGRKS